MDTTTSVIQTVTVVWPTAQKYVQYQRDHKDYVRKFQTAQRNLKCLLEDVQTKLNTQLEQHGKKEMDQVKNWRAGAHKETLVKVEDLICKGGCFTHICSSTKLENKTKELENIIQNGEEFNSDDAILVKHDHSIKGDPLYVEEISGRDDIQKIILECLKGDNVKIAVCGMGGVGKTIIMRHVHNKLLKESKFDKVYWVTVAEDSDILKFQRKIASSLELKLELQDENETKLARLISRKLRQGSNVLILDDVRNPFPLGDVGIPNLDGNNGCKIVLTTQVEEVAHEMNCAVIPVEPLPNDEALTLFLNIVGKTLLSDGRYKRDVGPILMNILEKCDGLPLAIVTVAMYMKGKLDPRSWKLALSKMSRFENIVDCLKLRIGYLAPQVQDCFLSCALYPKSYEISEEELIEYWIEEGFIYKEEQTRDTMNCEGHEIFEMLVKNRLLKLVKVSDEEHYVTMHDLFRDIALDINPQFWVKDGKTLEMLLEHESKEKLLKVSIMNNYIREIPSSMSSLKCSNLTTFLLSNNEISTIPEVFFEGMLGLKILNLSNNPRLSSLPGSVSKLENLTTLLLRGCWSLTEVPSLSNLGDLRKLDLSGTSIKELPQGLNMLTNLKYLGLG